MKRSIVNTIAGMLGIVALGLILGYTYPSSDTGEIDSTASSWPEVASPTPAPIALDEVKAKLDSGEKVVVLDARSAADFEAGHIKGALSLPLSQFEDRYPEISGRLTHETEIVVYCTGTG